MRRKIGRKGLLLAIFFVIALLVAGCGPKLDQGSSQPASSSSSSSGSSSSPSSSEGTSGTSIEGGEFVLGMAISLSGGTAKYGEAAKRGVEMAIEEFNASGGYNGKKAVLKLYDDEAKPEKSVEVVQRLITQDKAVAIVGPANSGNAKAHIKFTQEAKVPEVIPVATGTAITQTYAGEEKNYIFRIAPFDSGQVGTMLKWAVEEKGFKKLALLHDTTGYGQGGKEDVLKQLKENYNLEPAVIESFQVGDPSMEPQLTKIKNANVDAIIFYGLAPEVAVYLKSRDKIGYYPITVASWAMGDPTVKELVGDLVNKNLYFVQSFTIDQSDKAKAFHEKVVAKYGEDIFPIATAQGYDSAKVILSAIKKVGLDSEKIRDAIENMTDFDGVTSAGAQPFSKDNHEALTKDNMFLATYKDGVIAKP
ncbi:ABC transporter substrate-binding protein [Microaerobacter geothermalis]|uniref:ABC transporter substrate-binding protein n=1 Tax=Microaerobacter geothermalis TaxID=674972 RepID=UPI001F169F03|nr:ABC transporter substrate-binding protein [Microaerobacter geothermalis]MCF6092577.1 ABC transporter substrate-binding protein [Microaerobacter geothermalis]